MPMSMRLRAVAEQVHLRTRQVVLFVKAFE
jgi:hypothetical protein